MLKTSSSTEKIVNKEGADSEASGRPRCPATAASSRFPTTTPRRKRKRKLEEVREDYIHPCMQPRHDDETTTTAATATRTTVK
ncbi:hypothetical protein EUGRSUZ_F04139 [Eucalyptus grandis]|uniref:Uncharacterized protein n=2 Tax=Eucalyptus grandis TaxID=71139 RepID=A0ACC3KPS6_EUCGR|nr:hypothetical protein EUGRSUZ_F04139 [Eucalyptus grandis]